MKWPWTPTTTLATARENSGTRLNAGESPLTDEDAATSRYMTYQDQLVRYHKYQYIRKSDIRCTMLHDAIASRLTFYLGERLLSEPFSFFESHRPDAAEVESNDDLIAQLRAVGYFDVAKEVLPYLLADGYQIVEMGVDDTGGISHQQYGRWECPPLYWKRAGTGYPDPNLVMGYDVSYVPMPEMALSANLQHVYKQFGADDIAGGNVLHLTRGTWNYGVGDGILRPAWDSVIKLRMASNADQFLRDVRFLIQVPEDWNATKIDRFLGAVDQWTSTRYLVVRSVQQAATREPVGLPSMGYVSMKQDPSGTGGMHQKSTTGETLQDPEYGRLFIATGFTKDWWVGGEAGALSTGEVNMTADLKAEKQAFSSIRDALMKLMFWYAGIGAVDLSSLPPTFELRYWQEAEMIYNQSVAMSMQQQELDQKGEAATADSKKNQAHARPKLRRTTAMERLERRNAPPQGVLAPITSSWVKAYGYDDKGQFVAQFHGSPHTFTYPGLPGEQTATAMEQSGSPGGFVHDNPGFWGAANYDEHGSIPQGMAPWGGSQAALDSESDAARREKVRQFGSARPAMQPNLRNYPGQTHALTESTTGPIPGMADLAGIVSALQQMMRAQPGSRTTTLTPLPSTTTSTPASSTAPVQGPSPTGHLGTQGTGAVGRPITARTTGGEIPATAAKGHGGRSRRGRPAAGMRGGQSSDTGQSGTMSYTWNGSFEDMNAIFKRVTNSSIGKETFYKLKDALPELLDYIDTHGVARYNEVNIGKSMDFNHPLRYPGVDHDEYVCQEDWQTYVSGTTVPLQIYHENMAYPAGAVQFSKDAASGEDVYLYDRQAVMDVLRRIGKQNSRLYKKLEAGLTPALSTEYDCDTVYNAEKGKWFQKRFRNVSVALVDQGNCPDHICALKRVDNNGEIETI